MPLTLSAAVTRRLDDSVNDILRRSRVPGAAVAIATSQRIIHSQGYGYRDLETKSAMTASTLYPIASTTKAINATLIGMMVDDGRLAWDIPIQHYLPSYRVEDPAASAQTTLRDLLCMRTGIPRHDWMWIENSLSRAALVERMPYLECAYPFRERFRYNNLTHTVAAHVAEIVADRPWETLVRERIFEPLAMTSTRLSLPTSGEVTSSYHEGNDRELRKTMRFATDTIAPAGGTIYSTIADMAKWASFNLHFGCVDGQDLIQAHNLKEIFAPHVVARTDPSCPSPNATYAMGWFVDTYNGKTRVSHAGYLHDVHSEISLHPNDGVAVVSFTNFGCPRLSRLINQQAFDLILGLTPQQSIIEALAGYEQNISQTQTAIDAVSRVRNTNPSRSLREYVGIYVHPGYGAMEVGLDEQGLSLRRNTLVVPLEHWHYDIWAPRPLDLFPIHAPHAFDRSSRISFGADPDGRVENLAITLEPALAPVRFTRQSHL
jgi:CubicO group peptidase (beta-lactamase class C family)